jgi:hypothetical protein
MPAGGNQVEQHECHPSYGPRNLRRVEIDEILTRRGHPSGICKMIEGGF